MESINLSRLLREGGSNESQGELHELVLLSERIPLEGPASWKVSLTRIDGEEDELWMSGEIAGKAAMECRRCLGPALVPVRAHFQHLLRYQADHPLEAVDVDGEEIFLFGHPDLDLTPFLSEAFALELPYTVLCREDCQGLCEECGANLNLTPDCCTRSKPQTKLGGLLDELGLG
jgi:uncharacterized protein